MARFLISFVALFAYANGFCMNMPGGIGEYHQECTTTSIGMCPYNYLFPALGDFHLHLFPNLGAFWFLEKTALSKI